MNIDPIDLVSVTVLPLGRRDVISTPGLYSLEVNPGKFELVRGEKDVSDKECNTKCCFLSQSTICRIRRPYRNWDCRLFFTQVSMDKDKG